MEGKSKEAVETNAKIERILLSVNTAVDSIGLQVGEVHDAVSANHAQTDIVGKRISGKNVEIVGKMILKCDYILKIQTFCVFFQRKFVILYQEQ